jgi:hypothetical protein
LFQIPEEEEAMKKYQELENRVKYLEEQLGLKTRAVTSLTNQLGVSLRLLKSLKGKYDIKEREASLYRIQMQNLLKTLAKEKLMSRGFKNL